MYVPEKDDVTICGTHAYRFEKTIVYLVISPIYGQRKKYILLFMKKKSLVTLLFNFKYKEI